MRAGPLLATALLLVVAFAGCLDSTSPVTKLAKPPPEPPVARRGVEPHVVVATLDTGVNPFHPAWRRDQNQHPSAFIPGYPRDALSLNLQFKPKMHDSVNASSAELDQLKLKQFPYWVPGTNLIGLWAQKEDRLPVFHVNGSSHSHGAQASSQIAGAGGYSIAPEAWIVIMDRTVDGGGTAATYAANAEGLRWAADQPWIDIIHTNIQNPVPLAREQVPGQTGFQGFPAAVLYAVQKGKLVVSAGGNFWVEATETSPHAGPPGVLVAGANDNCGYTDFSNPNPHVVMDGSGTVSAAPYGYGNGTFGGTSSASPRISGYAAKVLYEVRKAVNYTGGVQDGAMVVVTDPALKPAKGPLADGRFTAAELHEVIRKTANPNPHPSKFDGGQSQLCVPQPAPSPVAVYAKMGYGEVSEHTIQNAIDVALGKKDAPIRAEDAFYLASEQARTAFWRVLPG